jgi:TolA-binding protein
VQQFEALVAKVPAGHYLVAAAHYGAGEALREMKDDERAAMAFAAAAEAATGDSERYKFPALYQLGFAQSRRQQHADAAAAFAQAAAAAGDDAQKGECFYLSGDALLRLQEHDAAARAFGRAQKLASEFADDAALGLGWVAVGKGDRKAAVAAFTAFLEKHAGSPLAANARLELGRALYQDGKAEAAQQALAPLRGDGTPGPVRQQAEELLGLCALATGAGEQAVASLQQALAAAKPEDKARLSFALGEALSNLERWQEALAAYNAVGKEAPEALRGDAAYGACFALHALGKHAESIARAEQVLALPNHRLAADAQLALAENRFALQQYEPAAAAYAKVVDGPHRRTAQWKLAWCGYLRGDKAAAAKGFAGVAADAESSFAEEALAMQALATLESGDADAALQTADRYRARHRDGAFLDRTERVAARVLKQKGDLQGAAKRLATAAQAAQKSGGAAAASGDVVEQAELAYQQGDFQAADAQFAQLAERTDALGARALAGRAWCAFELGDAVACGKALAAAKAHPQADGELVGLLELESALHHRQQDWPAAIAVARTFLERFGKHGKAPAMTYALGVAQARSGDAKAARATLAQLAERGGHDRMDRVHYELAWACRRAGDEPAALAAFAKVAAGSQDVELQGEANLHCGVARLEQKDLAGAVRHLEVVQGSQRPRALYRLGFAEFESASTDKQVLAKARERFTAVAAMPGEELAPECQYLAAECAQRLGDHRAVAAGLRPFLQQHAAHARAGRARLVLGDSALQLGDHALVVEALEPFVREGKPEPADEARACLWLGRARMARKEHDAAEQLLTRVTERSDGPLAAEAQFRLGENRTAKGDLRGAADAFVKLPILYAHAEWVRRGLLHAGLTYEGLQQPDKAQRFFQELVKDHAGSDEAKTAAAHIRPN